MVVRVYRVVMREVVVHRRIAAVVMRRDLMVRRHVMARRVVRRAVM